MAMKPFKRAVAVTGTYEVRGETKKRYCNVGTLFQYDDGGFALKLDTVPVGDGWNGFISFYDIEERGGGKAAGGSSSGQPKESCDLNDDIPFVRIAGDFDV